MFAPLLLQSGTLHVKVGRVFLRLAVPGEEVVTVVDGKVETCNVVPDDGQIYWISHADTTSKERIVLKDRVRCDRYHSEPAADAHMHPDRAALESEGFTGPFEPLGRALALEVTPELLRKHLPSGKFVAKWGAEMLVEVGDYLCAPVAPLGQGEPPTRESDIHEVYRIARSMFEETYRRSRE